MGLIETREADVAGMRCGLTTHTVPSDERFQLFEHATATILARHDWHLLDKMELVTQAASLAVTASTLNEAERACQQVYARHLYAALQNPVYQELAYGELHGYLYRIALRQRPEVAEDAAQEAILLVHQKLHTCRDPGAFLKFAIFQLLTAFHHLAADPHESSLADLLEKDDSDNGHLPFVSALPTLESEVTTQIAATDLLRWLRTVIETNPRAKKQILAVALKYLEGWEDEAIAATLETSVANVHVLRSRGLIKLREEYQKHFSQVQDS